MQKLCVFDFDGTLMNGETIDLLAEANGVFKQSSEITAMAMNGEIDFMTALEQRIKLLKGMSLDTVKTVCQNLPIMPNADYLIKTLRAKGYKVIIMSGGFEIALEYFSQKIPVDGYFANHLQHQNNILTGKVGGTMLFDNSKGVLLAKLQKLLNINQEQTITVGDGANDLSMFKQARHRIAFCAKPILQEAANIIINEKDLAKVLDFEQKF